MAFVKNPLIEICIELYSIVMSEASENLKKYFGFLKILWVSLLNIIFKIIVKGDFACLLPFFNFNLDCF